MSSRELVSMLENGRIASPDPRFTEEQIRKIAHRYWYESIEHQRDIAEKYGITLDHLRYLLTYYGLLKKTNEKEVKIYG